MKLFAFVLLVGALGVRAQAQSLPSSTPPVEFRGLGDTRPTAPKAAVKSSLNFDARTVSNGGAGSASSAVSASSAAIARERQSQTVVELRVRNFSAAPASARFEWFFIAQDLQTKKAYVWSRGDRTISLQAGAEAKELVQSEGLAQSTTSMVKNEVVGPAPMNGLNADRIKVITSKSSQGGRPVGWIVRMLSGYDVVAVQASSSELERIGADPSLTGIVSKP